MTAAQNGSDIFMHTLMKKNILTGRQKYLKNGQNEKKALFHYFFN